MKNSDGDIRKDWQELADIARQHFTNLVGVPTEGDEGAMEEVLRDQQGRISEASKEALEAPITLEELHRATINLLKNKVSGKDGIPVEFYLKIWEQVGPILFEVLRIGLEEGILNP